MTRVRPHRSAARARGIRPLRALGTVTVGAALVFGFAACAPEPDAAPAPSTSAPVAVSPTAAAAAPELAAFPTGPSTSTTALPSDCRAILTPAVLAELEGVSLNAPGMGGGIRADSSRVCIWGEPGSVGTWLATVIGYAPDRDARDALYALGNDGYTCYEPRGGIRCEKTWQHPSLPVEQGRTLFYRDGVIVDTQYSNLAPKGYTNAVIAALWPAG
ncbi:hypothetical protein N3K63_02285 [Microbacterium sp. W1N]|uniref:hypothetical protein n=1 Tax=Microbacterium festucae TaxID=2977531 RepID=UPI0021BDF2A6|nr:hypothetical protein [Microbacterium festucae]MCT9819109.1 hypothetical protein [Microbacterium festucae]